MPIDFLDLLAADGWAPVPVVPEGAVGSWSGSGAGSGVEPLAHAPVDVVATFAGARRSTGIDPSFGLHGVRLGAGFAGPIRSHDQPLLMIVFGGSLTVRSEAGDGDGGVVEHRLRAGEFCIVDEGTVHSLAAGDDGATYTECWPQDVDLASTTWFPGDAWAGDQDE